MLAGKGTPGGAVDKVLDLDIKPVLSFVLQRPYDIHSNSSVSDIRHLYQNTHPHYPSSWNPAMTEVIKQVWYHFTLSYTLSRPGLRMMSCHILINLHFHVKIPVDLVPNFCDGTNWFELCLTVFNWVLTGFKLVDKKT